MASRINRVRVENDYNDPEETYEEVSDSKPRFRTGSINSGWGAPKQETRQTVKVSHLDMKSGKRIIKIHDQMPTARFRQHYVNSQNSYFTCMQERDDDGRIVTNCPLCVAGHYATQQFRMNVTDLKEPSVVKVWTFGRMVEGILKEFLDDENLSPLNKESLYFQVWRTKPANGSWTYTILPLRARYLQEEYSTEPLTAGELEDASNNLYGEETVWIHSEEVLQEAADKLTEKDLKRN